MSKQGKSRTREPVEILVVVCVLFFVFAIAGPVSQKSRFDADRIRCENNLSVIGKAMQIYTNDYDGKFPKSSGRNSVWTPRIPDWMANNRYNAYGLAPDGSGGYGTISSCFYLLVKYAEVSPKTFVCPGDAAATTFSPTHVNAVGKRFIDLWDFGPTPGAHCSYSYHMPFGLYALTTSSNPRMPVAADPNPWMSSASARAKNFDLFNPEGDREAVKAGNSIVHQEEGQNVLFVDGHVNFEDSSTCGIRNDNIYTFWDGGDIRRGIPVVPFVSEPQDRTDSMLVNDPGVYKSKTTKQPKDVNSADLEHTSVIATLDCPMPEHKNVIWCGTFQICWDKFKNDIIQEPVRLIGVRELDDRLNQEEFSPENLEPESFYATAGFVKNGILQEIKEEMTKRFPSKPTPVFSKFYETLPLASIAYSFLSIDVEFKYPFYTNNEPFTFQDSDGARTNITSFCAHTEVWDQNTERVREQVEILYDNYQIGRSRNTTEFVVDLCKHTNPYQIVLARIPLSNTLRETLETIEQKIFSYKQNPKYKNRSKLDFMDELIIPDILFKLTHHFKELEWKNLSNPKWREVGYFIFEARQMVEFSLSRTGVMLKLEGRLGAGAGIPRQMHFDRPFLIYVKKRGAEYSPFFVMWVDNAELMERL